MVSKLFQSDALDREMGDGDIAEGDETENGGLRVTFFCVLLQKNLHFFSKKAYNEGCFVGMV